LFPKSDNETVSADGQTLHELKPMSLPKTAKSRKNHASARKSNSKTRSKRGGAKSKKSKKEAEMC